MIRGMGCSLPERVMTNADFEKTLDTSDEWIRTRTGIRERRIAGDGENTLTMALEASQQALGDAGLEPNDVDLIVLATSTPFAPLPATACFLQDALGCRHIPAFDISAACSGFVYALVVAAGMMKPSGYRHALIIGAETMSAVTDFEDRSTCILLGDAAGAAVLSHADNDVSGIYDHFLGANGGGAEMIWVPAGGSLEPPSYRTIDERQHYLKMRGREVYKFAVTKFVEVMTGAIERVGITVDDLALVIPHQSNLRIIESAADKLGLPMDRMSVNIDRYGNTSAASIPVALAEARQTGQVKPGDWVLLAGFGAGLTWGTALLRL